MLFGKSRKSVRRKERIPKPDDMSDSEDEDNIKDVLSSFGHRIIEVSEPYFKEIIKAVDEEIKKSNEYGSKDNNNNNKLEEAYSLLNKMADLYFKQKELDKDSLSSFENSIYGVSRPYFENMVKEVYEEIKKKSNRFDSYGHAFREVAYDQLGKMAGSFFNPIDATRIANKIHDEPRSSIVAATWTEEPYYNGPIFMSRGDASGWIREEIRFLSEIAKSAIAKSAMEENGVHIIDKNPWKQLVDAKIAKHVTAEQRKEAAELASERIHALSPQYAEWHGKQIIYGVDERDIPILDKIQQNFANIDARGGRRPRPRRTNRRRATTKPRRRHHSNTRRSHKSW
jgi:hypothetical protein